MEDMERRDTEDLDLEEIMREFSDAPQQEVPAEEPLPPEEVTVELAAQEEITPEEIPDTEEIPVAEESPVAEEIPTAEEMPAEDEVAASEQAETNVESSGEKMTGDTIRLDVAQVIKGVVHNAQPIEDEAETEEEAPAPEEETPAFTEQWEPEYEQPMGEYVPPQPIVFPARENIREMKRKLVVGPEKKYYQMSEEGLGRVQFAMFFALIVVVLSAISTIAYAKGLVPDNRLRLMIFGQCLAVLVSAMLGSSRLVQGVADLCKGRFTLQTLLVVTFLVCCVDGVFCLLQERIPCCAAFSLEILMAQWSDYNRRHAQMGQMDVLRKAGRLNGVCTRDDACEGKRVVVRIPGQVEHFMDNYDAPTDPEKRQNVYALLALCFSVAIGVYAGLAKGVYTGIQICAVSLLAAVPATAFVATTRPFAILQRRLHRLGAVLCGWQGVKQLTGKVIFPVNNEDIFPQGTTRMNGVKFFGSRPTEQVLAYATALVKAEGGALAPLFHQVLESRNGYHYEAEQLRYYDNGGIGGLVLEEPVLMGPMSFLKEMGVEVPEGIQVSQAVCVAIDGEFSGVFAISYEKTRSATAGLSTLSSYRGLNPVMVAGEFMLSESFIRGKFGIRSKRLQFVDSQMRQTIAAVEAEEEAQAALLTTMDGLAPMAFCVTGARALRTACNLGVALHIVGGVLGMLVVLTMVLLGAMQLLTPANMFLYQLVWMIPGWLVTEWTRSI